MFLFFSMQLAKYKSVFFISTNESESYIKFFTV